MAQKASVRLAGTTYEIQELSIKKARLWRKMLAEPFGEIVAALENAENTELSNLADVGALVQTFSGTLIGSIDILLDLLFAYSPELAADRERIEDEAVTSEALTAFVEVVKLAYPLSGVVRLVNGANRKPTR